MPLARARSHRRTWTGRRAGRRRGGGRRRAPRARRRPPRRSARAACGCGCRRRSLPAGLGVDEREVADVGQLLLARVVDLDRDHLVARGERQQRRGASRAAPRKSPTRTTARGRGPARPTRFSASAGEVAPPPSCAGSLAQRVQGREQAGPALSRRHGRARGSPNVTRPSRLPRRDASWPSTRATPSATSALAPVRRPEGHGGRGVEHEPGRERPLGDVDAHVRLAGARGRVPVDAPDVVAGHVRPDLRQLLAVAARVGAVIAADEAVDPPRERQVERLDGAVRRSGPGRAGPASARGVGQGRTLMRPRPGPSRGAAAARRRGRAASDGVRLDALGERLVASGRCGGAARPARARRRPAAGRSGGRAPARARGRRGRG